MMTPSASMPMNASCAVSMIMRFHASLAHKPSTTVVAGSPASVGASPLISKGAKLWARNSDARAARGRLSPRPFTRDKTSARAARWTSATSDRPSPSEMAWLPIGPPPTVWAPASARR
jgi:hypothetical protein